MSSTCESLPAQPENEAAPAANCEEKNYPCVHSSRGRTMSCDGTWLKLIRVTAYVLRAVKLFKTKSM